VPLQTLQQRQDGKGTLELIVTQILTKANLNLVLQLTKESLVNRKRANLESNRL
jgi:hypothetical protein